ncbi:oxidoreductase [Undibacterium terreum]|uniref:Enoyl reductase (ER) domain-containing protein n=1 Tax=Undibacterium terreum TaxID=1224302 RepID=A0A916XKL7_9BURK|nr:zinc-binding dehydrogenase [Undibacterium terreum]GGC77609.1 hypothetical protein GCM10011396_25950 [Undibacterium terreum]
MNPLFTPLQLGGYSLRNRLVMSPMTRSRADDISGVPSDSAVIYYAQRADAGLIITEGTQPSPMGKGYVRTPGIHTAAQVQAWRAITDAVHQKGSRIFLQIMHTGRISHRSLLPGEATPVAPSAVLPAGSVFTASGPLQMEMPRALQTAEVAGVIEEYRLATRHALEAGFDGVELHAASGYLPEQFLSSSTNQRSDQYGGSLANRARFILEVLAAMVAEAGGDRVGIKIAPEMNFNDISDAAPQETYRYLVQQLAPLKLAYLHVALYKAGFDYHALLRPLFGGAYLQGGGLDKKSAETLISSGHADAAVFGSLYLANPDLAKRFMLDAPLNTPDRNTFFSPGTEGYIDYPTLEGSVKRALRIHSYGGEQAVQLDAIAEPKPAAGEVIVAVHAAGINGLDWKIRDGMLQSVFPLSLPATLGIELAGEIVSVSADVAQFKPGDRVMGAMGALGAYADRVAISAEKLALIPAGLSELQAAAIPVAALTAWQALFEAGELKPGQRVLIHGAAGGVGGFAVQLARRAGAHVIGTAQLANVDYLKELGAHQVIDYRSESFWASAENIDLVLDLVGSSVLANSWQLLAAGGRIVSTAAPEITAVAPAGKRGIWFQMRPDSRQLAELAALVAQGELKARIAEVVELADAAAAIERNKTGHGPGKSVVKFAM